MPLSYHSDKSPSAANVVGGFKDMVGTPFAVLDNELSEAPASPTLLDASLPVSYTHLRAHET